MSLDSLQRVLCGVERMLRGQDEAREFIPFPDELNCPAYSYRISVVGVVSTGIDIMNTDTGRCYSFCFGTFSTNALYFEGAQFQRMGLVVPYESVGTKEGSHVSLVIDRFREFLAVSVEGTRICRIGEINVGLGAGSMYASTLTLRWSVDATSAVDEIYDLSGMLVCKSFMVNPS